jgi:hypothetical protein
LSDLILHQSDQWRNHDNRLAEGKRGQLIAEGFAAASGHHHRSIATSKEALNDPLLHRAERIVAPVTLQGRVEFLHC